VGMDQIEAEMSGAPRKFEFKLTPAATVYREKLMLRQRSDLPDGLCSLPGFRFHSPVKSAAPDAQKVLAKGMIQLIASALVQFASLSKSEMQFVSTVMFGLDDREYEFAFDCPFPKLVELAKHNVQNPRTAIAQIENLQIKYKMMLPNQVRVPLVFVYSPQKSELLVSNEHHLQNPRQFLDPELCRTTSGFLNFVGTFLLLDKIGEDSTFMETTLAKGNVVTNRGVDEWLRWLYCLVDTNTIYETERILVNPQDAEQYFYVHPK
jgi:hypothetical protein